jgi:hypothetical protein
MERSLRIEVHARGIRSMPDIFQGSAKGQREQLADGITIRNDGTHESKAVDFPAVIHLTLEFAERGAEAVGFGVIATWLYDKLNGHVHPDRRDEKLVIEHTEVEVEEGAIKRVITERLTSEKRK